MNHISGSALTSGDTVYLYANVHSPSTGAANDADSVPTYRIYAGNTSSVVATGSFAKLDDDNTLGFYAASVALSGYPPGSYVAYISATVGGVTGTTSQQFHVGGGTVVVRTTIASLDSQTSFTLTNGPPSDGALLGCTVIVRDASNVSQVCAALCTAYAGSTKTVTLPADPGIFTMAVGDQVEVLVTPKQLPAALPVGSAGLPGNDTLNTAIETIPTAIENADALLTRNVSSVQDSAPEHSMATIVLAILESQAVDGVWTIYKVDGTTVYLTKTLTTDPNADPITKVS